MVDKGECNPDGRCKRLVHTRDDLDESDWVMHSWVRYSVAVYVGLLLAGAAVLPTDAELERAASAKQWLIHFQQHDRRTALDDIPPAIGRKTPAPSMPVSWPATTMAPQVNRPAVTPPRRP